MTDRNPIDQGPFQKAQPAPAAAGRDTLSADQQFAASIERDTEPSLDVSGLRDTLSSEKPRAMKPGTFDPAAQSTALEPNVQEHGVWGTTSEPVGGFGESYDAQVARGSEPDLPSGAPANAPEDAPLEREVRKTLGRAHVDAADLRVTVHGDHVTLYGTVREALEKTQIEARARGVPGVGSLTSHLKVQSAPGSE